MIVEGPNPGAQIALNAIGKQDTYLLENDPENSFFKYDPKRHSNFQKFHFCLFLPMYVSILTF